MSAFLRKTGFTSRDCHEVVRFSRERALKNPRASYGTVAAISQTRRSTDHSPLDRAPFAEGSVVVVLASEHWIRRHHREAVYIEGLAWRSSLPWYEGGSIERAEYATQSLQAATKQTGKEYSPLDFDVLEVDDAYSYKLIQHLHSVLPTKKETSALLWDHRERINPSGGSMGVGYLIEATALHRIAECALQLRGEAGPLQVRGAKKALVLSWRGIPTASGGAAILSS
jgi:acetyl-CoA C-acetyltransferase